MFKKNIKKTAKKVKEIFIWRIIITPFVKLKNRIKSFLSRRPHRSFRMTRRRDYARSLKLPGLLSFTKYVAKTIWARRNIFILLAIFYSLLTALTVGIGSQETYSTLVDTIKTSGGESFTGFFGEVGKAGLLLFSTATGGLSGTLDAAQQIYACIAILLAWLTSVWLMRNLLAGHKVKLRDGLYSAGAPILSTLLVLLMTLIQLLPIALAFIGYSAASMTGILNSGVEAMLFWISASLLASLSLYFVTSTIFALVIVTLPGMYPMQAIKIAGDLVVGRRMRILLRLLWMLFLAVLVWVIVMIPLIIFDGWIKVVWASISWLPIIPIFLLIMSSVTVIWISNYVYLFYRKVVADEAAPA